MIRDVRQLRLFEDDGRPPLDLQLHEYQAALMGRGLERVSARAHVRHLRSMLAGSGARTIEAFLTAPERAAASVAHGVRVTRIERHRTLLYALDAWESRLPADTRQAVERALDDRFGARVHPRPHLVDRNLGGTSRRVRGQALLLPVEVERLIDAAPDSRDRTLLAVLAYSGLTASQAIALDWPDVPAGLPDGASVAWIDVAGTEREVPIEPSAVERLNRLRAESGGCREGPVFVRHFGWPKRLDDTHPRSVLTAACRVAGLPRPDIRHLRLLYAVALLQRGWRAEAISRAFGYDSTANFRRAVEPFRQQLAGLRALETLAPIEVPTESRGRGSEAPASGDPATAGFIPCSPAGHMTGLARSLEHDIRRPIT